MVPFIQSCNFMILIKISDSPAKNPFNTKILKPNWPSLNQIPLLKFEPFTFKSFNPFHWFQLNLSPTFHFNSPELIFAGNWSLKETPSSPLHLKANILATTNKQLKGKVISKAHSWSSRSDLGTKRKARSVRRGPRVGLGKEEEPHRDQSEGASVRGI